MARAALVFPTVVPCGDVDARGYGKSYRDDGDQADPAIRPDMEWAAKDFGAALVDHTDQNRVGDDDDARDAQRSRQTRQVTPSAHRAMLEMRTVAGPSSVVQLSGDRQPHAARRSPLQGATADHLTRSEHSSFRAAHLFPAPVRPKRVLRYFTDHCRVATGGDAHRRRRSKHPRTSGLISVVQWRIGAARRCLLNVRAAPAAFAWPGKDEAARVRRPTPPVGNHSFAPVAWRQYRRV